MIKKIISCALILVILFAPACKKYDIEPDANDSKTSNATPVVADIDGNIYHTVKIGTQTWMVENLRVTKYRNGDPITFVPTTAGLWTSATYGLWAYYLDNSANNADYGKLYNWYAMNDTRGICPLGWHVPTATDWTTLQNYLGPNYNSGGSITNDAGGPLKESGTAHWWSPNTGATNSSGFTALPGGANWGSGCSGMGDLGVWWSSTYNSSFGQDCRIYYNMKSLTLSPVMTSKNSGFSIRCIKD